MKKYYLLKAWQTSRGTTEENPAYFSGPTNIFYHQPLENVNPEHCYQSEKRAQRVADKYNGGQLWVRYKVVEVPHEAILHTTISTTKVDPISTF